MFSAFSFLTSDQISEAVEMLSYKQYTDYMEFQRASYDFARYRKRASQLWSPLLDRMSVLDEIGLDKEENERALKNSVHWATAPNGNIYAPGLPPLPQCAWCSNRSMALRTCARCEKVKYCDAQWFVIGLLPSNACFDSDDVTPFSQKKHWTDGHKAECLSPEIPV